MAYGVALEDRLAGYPQRPWIVKIEWLSGCQAAAKGPRIFSSRTLFHNTGLLLGFVRQLEDGDNAR